MFRISPAQARNAYSACLLLPGVGGGLRFHPLLGPYKKIWNTNTQKYGVFWDPTPVLMALAEAPPPKSIADIRLQFILCSRLLCLYRSSDLSNLKRTVSVLSGAPFIKIKRKGQKFAKWERMVSFPEIPHISPFHLLQKYVELTRSQGKPGEFPLL